MTNHEELLERAEVGRQAKAFLDSAAYRATVLERGEALRDAILALKPGDSERFTLFRAALCTVEELDRSLAALVSDGESARVEVEEGKKTIIEPGRVL